MLFFSDSLSVLQALNHTISKNQQIQNILLKQHSISEFKTIVNCCVPSHVGIYGNKQVDKKAKEAAPVAEWLRSLTSVLLIIRSSHRCGFAPRSGHESHVGQAKFCLRVCQVVFPRVLRFSPHLPIDSSRYE